MSTVTGTLPGAGIGNQVSGAAGSSLASQASAETPAPARTSGRRTHRPGKAKPAASNDADSNSRTITITLPKDVVEWYEQQASQAPYEPSVQKYVAWQLRQLRQQMTASQASRQMPESSIAQQQNRIQSFEYPEVRVTDRVVEQQ